ARPADAIVAELATPPANCGRGARAARTDDATPLPPGDLVVLQSPDAAIDVDDRAQARPALVVAGAARVTMIRGDGTVLADVEAGDPSGKEATVPVPPETALIAVQSDGQLDVVEGMAGWHEQARVAALGTHVALGAGCTLAVDAPRAAPQLGWMTAADVVRDATSVTTRFERAPRTLVVVVAEAAGESLEGIELSLRGAARARQRDGTPRPPTIVMAGAYTALVYPLAASRKPAPAAVTVRGSGDRRLAGVLAGATTVEETARLLAERGVTAVAGRVLAAEGAGCRVRWEEPKGTRGVQAPADALKTSRAGRKTTTTKGGTNGRR
ncbi:hypothetical protein, partial [Roseisolibacter sp. H3M3-2]|uniref:hypothetical protein n=1 Tax=Roseisolibacter sp. H3M3-2 TaxID=3031323 RepID=UPI0023DC3577